MDLPRRRRDRRLWVAGISKDYAYLTGGMPHVYIPVLAVSPAHRRKGYGDAIIRHLVEMAAVLVRIGCDLSDYAFLDVYEANHAAVRLYSRCEFQTVGAACDPLENNERYLIMAQELHQRLLGA